MEGYKITKEKYKAYVTDIIILNKIEHKLGLLGINLFDFQELEKVKHDLEELIEYCSNDKYTPRIGTSLSYFLYDLNCGKDPIAKEAIVDDGKTISLTNVDELWNYINSHE